MTMTENGQRHFDPFAVGGEPDAYTLKQVAKMVRTDGRRRIIITLTEAGDGFEWDRTMWIGLPIAHAFSILCQFLPAFRAMEQAAILGLVLPEDDQDAREGPSDAPYVGEIVEGGEMS